MKHTVASPYILVEALAAPDAWFLEMQALPGWRLGQGGDEQVTKLKELLAQLIERPVHLELKLLGRPLLVRLVVAKMAMLRVKAHNL